VIVLKVYPTQQQDQSQDLKHKKKLGQTTIEYLLILSVVVGMVAVFKTALSGPLGAIVQSQMTRVETSVRGGEKKFEDHYLKGGHRVEAN